MRKITLLMLLLVAFSTIFAQKRNVLPEDGFLRTKTSAEKMLIKAPEDATYKFTARLSSDRYEAKRFFYGNQDLVIAVKDSIGNEQVIDSIFYDAQHNVTQISGNQLISGNWKNVYKVFYAYDAAGNMIQRTNFNTMGTETFTQGGVYDYTYDNMNRLVSHTLYLGDYQYLCETGTYYYDQNGHRYLDVLMSGFNTLDSSMKIYYYYDNNGRMTSKTFYMWNGYGWDEDDTELYVYDYAGNCIEHSVKNANGQYTDRKLYEYNSIGSSEVSMPYYIPELGLPEAYDDANMRVLEHWYTWDDNHVLQYICDYAYIYNDLPWGIEEYDAATLTVGPNPTNGICTVRDDQNAIEQVLVFDMFGRLIQMVKGNNQMETIDLSSYPAGMYLLKISLDNGYTTTKKLVKE